MSRWIDADVLIAELQKDEGHFDKEAEDTKDDPSYTEGYSDAMWSRANGIRDAIVEVYDAPSIDIVRCQDCKWFDSGKNDSEIWSMCTRHFGKYIDVNADDFCSYGCRKESE